MSLLLAFQGAAPADGGIPWQLVDWFNEVELEDEESPWICGIFEALAAAAPDPVAFAGAEDEQLEDEPEPFYQVTPPLNDVVVGCYEVDELEEDELPFALAAIIEDVQAATDFIQSLTDVLDDTVDDEGLFDLGWNAAFDPPAVGSTQQPIFWGVNPRKVRSHAAREEERKRLEHEERELLGILPKEVAAVIKQVASSPEPDREALKTALAKRRIKYLESYAATLDAWRREIRLQQEEEEEVALVLLMH